MRIKHHRAASEGERWFLHRSLTLRHFFRYGEPEMRTMTRGTEEKGSSALLHRIEALVKNALCGACRQTSSGQRIRARSFVTSVSDEVKSAKLTAEWESKLQQIEHGSLPEAVFMSGITQFITEMCGKYGSVDKSV